MQGKNVLLLERLSFSFSGQAIVGGSTGYMSISRDLFHDWVTMGEIRSEGMGWGNIVTWQRGLNHRWNHWLGRWASFDTAWCSRMRFSTYTGSLLWKKLDTSSSLWHSHRSASHQNMRQWVSVRDGTCIHLAMYMAGNKARHIPEYKTMKHHRVLLVCGS